MIEISFDRYLKKITGCFSGKAIGGTLGMPYEGFIGVKKVDYYDPIPSEMVGNDDLDNQVVWLETIHRFGLPINRHLLGDAFRRHVLCVFDEYCTATRNIRNGLYPPLSGYYDSKFTCGMGAAIRAEIWACLAPGDPALAVRFAREDACIDHCGDGIEAEVFIAAVESAAFTESDPQRLVENGLKYINPNSQLFAAITMVCDLVREGKEIFEIRELILSKFFSQNWTDVRINLAFVVAGLLNKSVDNGQILCTVAGMGHDADCTCATLGAILGIINPDGFEERWTKPIGEELVVSSSIGSIHEVSTISEFCQQIAETCIDVLSFYNSSVILTNQPDWVSKRIPIKRWADCSYGGYQAEQINPPESVIALNPITISLYYPENVALAPGERGKFRASFSNPCSTKTNLKVNLTVPHGWSVTPAEFSVDIPENMESEIVFYVTAPKDCSRRRTKNPLDFGITIEGISYTVSAGLPQTFEYLCASGSGLSEKCPHLNGDVRVCSTAAHNFEIDDGEQVIQTEFRAPYYVSEAIMAVQGTRPIRVWIDEEQVLSHDGAEFVPAFHRSDYIKTLSLDSDWHRLTVWCGAKNYDGSGREENPHNAIVSVEGSMTTAQYRKKYEQALGQNEGGELFIGFAERSAYRWLDDLEWRIPLEYEQISAK